MTDQELAREYKRLYKRYDELDDALDEAEDEDDDGKAFDKFSIEWYEVGAALVLLRHQMADRFVKLFGEE